MISATIRKGKYTVETVLATGSSKWNPIMDPTMIKRVEKTRFRILGLEPAISNDLSSCCIDSIENTSHTAI